MKRKIRIVSFLMIMGLLVHSTSSVIMAQTLKHSYTFEDGTAKDIVGNADGVLHGDAVIENGQLILSGSGFVSLSGKTINIPEYESVSIEAFFNQSAGLTGNTPLFSFGRFENEWKGVDYFFFQPTREDGTSSRTAISTGEIGSPWENEIAVEHAIVSDIRTHHVVCVLTQTEIKLYFDGEFVGAELLTGTNALSAVSADTALIGMLVYRNDAKWKGAIEEFNIYEGTMTDIEIDTRFNDYMGDSYFDPRLSKLSASKGVLSPEFDPEIQEFELYVPYGTTSIKLNAVPAVPGAEMVIYNDLGNEIPTSGEVVFGSEGVDLEITVTALDGSTAATYYLTISHDPAEESATLSNIDLSNGELTTVFDSDSTEYTVIVPYGTTSTTVTGVPSWEGATVTGGGIITLVEGVGSTTITVISEDNNDTTNYNVDIFESIVTTNQNYFIQHEASSFVVGESEGDPNLIRLYNPIINTPAQLFQFVESGVEGQFFLKNQNDRYLTLTQDPVWDMVMTDVLTQDLDSCRFEIKEFEPNRFRIVTVARSESDKKYMGTNDSSLEGGVYSDKPIDNKLAIWNIKVPDDLVDPYDTYLSELTIDDHNLYPAFDMITNEYFVVLPAGGASLIVGATARDASATVTGTGTFDVSGKGSLTITVTAAYPGYSKDYVINYLENVPLTLKHSYTFADGTAKDVVGDAHGTLHGGFIENGVYTSDEEGDYISLPGEKIAINTYPTITMEVYFIAGDGTNVPDEMISWFGNTSDDNYGIDGLFLSHKSRVGISTGNHSAPWAAEEGVNSILLDDGLPHYMVGTLTNDSISLYVDGIYIGSQQLSAANKIFNLSNEMAYLSKGGYANDKTWKGSILEYNIYAGVMDESNVAMRFASFPVEDGSKDATLNNLLLDGETLEGFSSTQFDYTIEVTDANYEPFISVEVKEEGATATIVQASEIPGSAKVEVIAADGETKAVYTIEFTISTSIKENQKESVSVYPTVTSGDFTIKSKDQGSKVTVYDMTGNIVINRILHPSIDTISLQQAGVYIIKVSTQKSVKVFKVIKKN